MNTFIFTKINYSFNIVRERGSFNSENALWDVMIIIIIKNNQRAAFVFFFFYFNRGQRYLKFVM